MQLATAENIWWKRNFQRICVQVILRKLGIVSEDLIVIGSYFQIVGAATEKARLPILSLVLGKG